MWGGRIKPTISHMGRCPENAQMSSKIHKDFTMFICRSSFDLIFPTHRSWLLSLCVHPPAQRIADAIKRICYWGDYRVWVYSSRSANPLPSAFRAKTYSTALSLHSCVRLLVAEMARGFALCNFPALLQLFSALQIRDSSYLVNNNL